MKQSLKYAITNNLPFVVYRLPGETRVHILIQDSKALPNVSFNEIENLKGFVIAPFRGENINELICLKPDRYFVVNNQNFDFVDAVTESGPECPQDFRPGYVLTKEEYLKRAEYLIEVLQSGELEKVVFSRIRNSQLPVNFSWTALFKSLCLSYPKAFVYYASLPGIGCWVGATPELLLKTDVNHTETVALAGTQPIEKFNWSEKEIKEQQIVMDYIENTFINSNITDFYREGPVTVDAGNVVHLKTTYRLPSDKLKGKLGKLIAALHPTPAVCGLPRNKAYELICKVEKHERGLYSGFLGPWNLSDNSQLYVNLRCAELGKNRMNLYVGGGLTAESVAESEWEETIRKSETLLSIVEKL